MDERDFDENNKANVNLRSEKMRHIIGDIPPVLVRTGTVIILAVIVILAIAMTVIKIDGVPLTEKIFRL